jgi:hypothetical protein
MQTEILIDGVAAGIAVPSALASLAKGGMNAATSPVAIVNLAF